MKEWFKNIFKKKEKSDTVPKKHYVLLQVEFFLLFLLLLGVVWVNYDYMVFKILMVFNYSYTDTIDRLYEKEIGVTEKGKYLKYFDKLAIKASIDKIYNEGKDEFTFLYTPQSFEDTQEQLIAEEVTLKEFDENYNIIRLPSFVPENTEKFRKLMKENKSKSLIIDLTANPGGYVGEVEKLADLFLEKDTLIYYEKSRNAFYNKKYYAKNKDLYSFESIIILQDSTTASAAEIFINALKDNLDNVTLIGEKTYGKGIGQFQYPLKDGYVVKATAMEFFSPDDICINGIGIEADIQCKREDIYKNLENIVKNVQKLKKD